MVDFGFLYFNFTCVLGSDDLHVRAEHQFPVQNLAPLEAFSSPAQQSTPIRDPADRDESGQIDLDGILHSFDKSNTCLGNTSLSQWLLSKFPRKRMHLTSPAKV